MLQRPLNRRTLLGVIFVTIALVTAGCLGGTSANGDDGHDDSDGDSASAPGAAMPVDVEEIGASASDVPPPITRDEPRHVYFDIESTEVVAEMADGKTYTYWTFNDQVPGPMLRVLEGDTVTVNLTNSAGSTHFHNIDFHATTGPGGGAAALDAAPGETASVTFKAIHPGLFVYHCAYGAVADHIAHGMYGLILVQPAGEDLPPVDHEYYVVQGDFYSKWSRKAEGHHEYDYDAANDELPEWVVFNGRVGSLTGDRALTANVNETVRIYFGVGGPNKVSSFHIIGEHFDTVYDEGDLVSAPLQSVQTTLVAPGGATVVDLHLEYPGDYKLVDHSINRVHKGALGILHVEGPEDPSIFQP